MIFYGRCSQAIHIHRKDFGVLVGDSWLVAHNVFYHLSLKKWRWDVYYDVDLHQIRQSPDETSPSLLDRSIFRWQSEGLNYNISLKESSIASLLRRSLVYCIAEEGFERMIALGT